MAEIVQAPIKSVITHALQYEAAQAYMGWDREIAKLVLSEPGFHSYLSSEKGLVPLLRMQKVQLYDVHSILTLAKQSYCFALPVGHKVSAKPRFANRLRAFNFISFLKDPTRLTLHF